MIQVALPTHLRVLAQVSGPVSLELAGPATIGAALDALEAAYPVLRGTIRDRDGGGRRAFVRYFAGQQDLSHDPLDTPLPAAVTAGDEPLLVVAAMAGG